LPYLKYLNIYGKSFGSALSSSLSSFDINWLLIGILSSTLLVFIILVSGDYFRDYSLDIII
jgi:hypothetical protein